MTSPALRIAALTAIALPAPEAKDWRGQMERAIAQGHTAAWIAATRERIGSTVVKPGALSRAERAELRGFVERQRAYLDGFDPAGMSEAAIRARSEMYARATAHTYAAVRWGDWDIPQELMPGQQQCKANCTCSISIADSGDGTGTLTRTMGGTERHCKECPPLAGDHPVRRRDTTQAIKHGSHDQSSHGRRGGRGGGGGGGGRPSVLTHANEPSSPLAADLERRLRTIEDELANPYTSRGRRQFLETQRRALQDALPAAAPAQNVSAPRREAQNVSSSPQRQRLKQELDSTEQEIRKRDTERAIFFDADGRRLADVTGDATSYTLSQAQFDALRGVGATMTHNHPSGLRFSPGDPRHQGNSFSLADVRQAAALNLAEVRAVTPSRRFWMRPPPGGWQEHHWKTTIPNAYKRHEGAVLADSVQQVRAGRMTHAEGTARHYHEVWSRVAKELNIPYGVEDR